MLLLVAGCAGGAPRTVTLPPPAAPPAPAALSSYYEQDVTWFGCEGGLECARVVVPLDYAHPEGDRIELALKRSRAGLPGSRVGSLLINPGGPGVSGVSAVEPARAALGWDVRAVYDVVGFDPRGIGGSSPIRCVGEADLDEWRSADYDQATAAGVDRRIADARRLATECGARAGALLPFVDTESTARDLDVVRAVLGDERLHYLGVSYGTELGATYAGLFPERVGRMVLDAGLDPRMDEADRNLGLAAGVENALRTYVAACLTTTACPLTGTADEAVARVRAFLDDLARSPRGTGSARPLTASLAAEGILAALPDERSWPALGKALTAALARGDGRPLLDLADAGVGRGRDGVDAGNALAAATTVLCRDASRRTELADVHEHARRLREASPTFGPYLLDTTVLCSVWPVDPAGDSDAIRAPGAAPVLVIGTTEDPIAPYGWSVALAEQLDSGHLLRNEGFGHTAVGRSDACVNVAVEAFFLRGELPPAGRHC
jgi:pimeloyl-ACP methyl ester carboxylesterase